MAKNRSIKKVLVVGSGPVIIGQAAEFDYAGTQACLELRKEGVEVILINSNPATIMTDKQVADKIYIEPLNAETIKKICLKETPDSVLSNMGGQVGLNLCCELADEGFFRKQKINVIGSKPETIKITEDRLLFKNAMKQINEPCIESDVAINMDGALKIGKKIGLPLIIRPAFTLGGTGGGIAKTWSEFEKIAENGLNVSKIHQILVEKSVAGWAEVEFEVIRDSTDTTICICNMENIDPVGIHTGDSIVVAPCQTLHDDHLQMLRTSALKIISHLKIEGGCNVQYALNQFTNEYAVIEVNPRVSRSSALASKATGYPIARIATKIAIGYKLDEMKNVITRASSAAAEPIMDYVVVKIPKWPFSKFNTTERILSTQMKSTGEVMAIGNNLQLAILKAIRSLEEETKDLLPTEQIKNSKTNILLKNIGTATDIRIWEICELIRRKTSIEKIFQITKINKFFLYCFKKIIDIEIELKNNFSIQTLKLAKENGFSDLTISKIINQKNQIIHKKCLENKILPSYKMVDTCSGEIKAVTPYYYSTYDSNLHENAEHKTNKKKILIIGSGPIRIGQGIEFDYCNVHAIWALQKKGYEVIIVNSNPETVSTDFDIANKLYFEPLDYEDIKNIIDCERVYGVIVQFGGQTPIKIAQYLAEDNIKILGSSINAINGAENRKFFDKILNDEKIPRAKGITVLKLKDALNGIRKIGYPVIIRPSFVLGGQGMNVLYDDNDTKIYFNRIKEQGIDDNPVLIDQFLEGKEFEIDGICDGEDILIPGFIEHVEPAGVHSGDSMTIYPSLTLPKDVIAKATIYAKKLALALNIIGMFNIQFVYYANTVYVIELNPRSSRTIPYISKVTNLPLIDIAIDVILGKKLKNMKYGTNEYKRSKLYSVKMPIFSNDKIKGTDIYLGPEMKSTGEILGIDKNINNSLFKVFSGAGVDFNNKKNVIISINNRDKPKIIKLASKLVEKGYKILATNNTQKYLLKNHVNAKAIEKNIKGISKLIAQEKISFVVNTPTIGKSADRFGYQLRRMASENKIQLFTSIDTLSALLSAMDSNKNIDVYEIFNKAK